MERNIRAVGFLLTSDIHWSSGQLTKGSLNEMFAEVLGMHDDDKEKWNRKSEKAWPLISENEKREGRLRS